MRTGSAPPLSTTLCQPGRTRAKMLSVPKVSLKKMAASSNVTLGDAHAAEPEGQGGPQMQLGPAPPTEPAPPLAPEEDDEPSGPDFFLAALVFERHQIGLATPASHLGVSVNGSPAPRPDIGP